MDRKQSEAVVAAIKKYIGRWPYFVLGMVLVVEKTYANAKYKVKFLLNLLTQNGNEGRQIYDDSGNQELHVLEPMIFIEQKIDEHTNINAMFIFDAWTAASDTKLDGNTGASGEGIKQQARIAGKIGMGSTHQSHSWSGNMGISSEYDYRSLNFGGHYSQSFAQDNFTLALAPQLYLDSAAAYNVERAQTTGFKSRLIYSADVSGTQLLSPSDVIQFGYTHISMQGMLNNISNTVKVLNNTTDPFMRTAERLPNDRDRHAFYTRFGHAFSDEQSLFFNYRYYNDTWDLQAHTYEIGQRFTRNEENDFWQLTYRHYRQDSSRYHADQFATAQEFMTSDSDMDTFEAHRYGVHYSTLSQREKIFGLKLFDLEYTTALYYYQRSNDVRYVALQVGAGTGF